MREQPVSFAADGVALQGRLHLPQGTSPTTAAVLCHPHPLYGGDMDNPVVRGLATALAAAGVAALRFNFRGVGGSGGEHGGGVGEQEDVRSALDFVTAELQLPAASTLLAGYSFGACMALAAAATDPRVGALLAIAPPLAAMPVATPGADCVPLWSAVGDRDPFCPVAQFQEWFDAVGARSKRSAVIAGADHFFSGQVGALVTQLVPACLQGLGAAPAEAADEEDKT